MMETSWDVQVQAVDRQTFGAMVVSKTLDTLNAQRTGQGGSSLYDFQKDVLLPVYTGRGTIMDSWG
jgi:hypothetical protein